MDVQRRLGDVQRRLKAQKYSVATQITPDNVGKLKKAWETHTGDVSDGGRQADDGVVRDAPVRQQHGLYRHAVLSHPRARARYRKGQVDLRSPRDAEGADPARPEESRASPIGRPKIRSAGKACQKIVYIGTMDAKLYAVDADTGKPCPNFGKNGVLDIDQWNTVNDKWPLSLLQPPTVYQDTLFIGWAGKDWTDTAAPPGAVFALDAQTGDLKWTFKPSRPSCDRQDRNVERLGLACRSTRRPDLLYMPVSSPSPNFYGGDRKEPMPLATSVTALDPETGKVVWSRQLVHHDIWDYDTNSAPVLIDIKKDGKTIPALVQSAKQGFLYVLNRQTGEPIYPIDEKAVPKSDVAGEEASPTQPYVATPQPTVPDQWPGVSASPMSSASALAAARPRRCATTAASRRRACKARIIYPATAGGVEWGGGAVDPATRHICRQLFKRGADLSAARPGGLYEKHAGKTRLFPPGRGPVWHASDDVPQPPRHAVLEAALRHAVGL